MVQLQEQTCTTRRPVFRGVSDVTVFISYRRTDTQQAAGRLADRLIEHFGRDAVVIDVDTDQVGRDYRTVIRESLEHAEVVLALIGPHFFAKDPLGSQRLDNPDDPVRMELTRALALREVPVIPVLVDEAELPLPEQLPDDVQDLAFRGAVELAHQRFDRDYEYLEAQVGRHLTSAEPGPSDATRRDEPDRATPAVTARPVGSSQRESSSPPSAVVDDAAPRDPTPEPPRSTLATTRTDTAPSRNAQRRRLAVVALAAVLLGAGLVGIVVAMSAGDSVTPGADATTDVPSTSGRATTTTERDATSTSRPATTSAASTTEGLSALPPPSLDTPTTSDSTTTTAAPRRGPTVIIDTDANNEVDDQYAIAYLLLSDRFEVAGVTVNYTSRGGIEDHVAEAERVLALVDRSEIPVLPGATREYGEIVGHIGDGAFDGREAVDFIIETVRANDDAVDVFAIGKLTNVALALERAPDIADGMRVTWLGSNYPFDGGEHNLEHDLDAVNRVLDSPVDLQIAVVRVGRADGTAGLTVTPEENAANLSGAGPVVAPVTGRDGGLYTTFGDYAVALLDAVTEPGVPRPLYDIGAIAIAIDDGWAERAPTPAPEISADLVWTERPDNARSITIRDEFDRDAIIGDFYTTIAAAGG